jgi:hypothetical protein
VCWKLLDLAESVQARGPVALSVYDPSALGEINKSRDLTFGQRMKWVCVYLRRSKSSCDKLMKGEGFEMLVGKPF